MKFVVEISEEAKARKCFQSIAGNGKAIRDFKQMPFGPIIASAKDEFGIKWEIVIC